jgi:hypothetical protein
MATSGSRGAHISGNGGSSEQHLATLKRGSSHHVRVFGCRPCCSEVERPHGRRKMNGCLVELVTSEISILRLTTRRTTRRPRLGRRASRPLRHWVECSRRGAPATPVANVGPCPGRDVSSLLRGARDCAQIRCVVLRGVRCVVRAFAGSTNMRALQSPEVLRARVPSRALVGAPRRVPRAVRAAAGPGGRGLHSFTFQLNLSRF